jgi:CheY-like chemotaxis protein
MVDRGSVRQASLRILVVDDSRTVRTTICHWLHRRFPGCTCLEAVSGEEALTMVQSEPPAVVLVDVLLPGMSGFQTTKAIKALVPDLPVFVLSVNAEQLYEVAAATVGANAFVPKSAIAEQLFPLLDAFFQENSP